MDLDLEKINKKQYVDWKVKPVMPIKDTFGFRIILIMIDGNTLVQQKSGFKTKREANNERNNTITDLTNRTYVVMDKIKVKDYILAWLEQVMRFRITNDTYMTYSNSINKYIVPGIGEIYLTRLNSGDITKLFKQICSKTISGVAIARTVLKAAFYFAITRHLMNNNPVLNSKMPKEIKSKPYRILNIDSSKTLTLDQVKILIEASKDTKIHMQVLFAVLMGLRKSEINGLKYTDIDYIHRTIKVERQLGIKPNTKKEDFQPKTYSKQEIGLKTPSSYRELNIPDYVFEAILEQKKKYELNKHRRINDKTNPFQDLGYICCSSYGRPRSKAYVFTPFKKLLKDNNLPNIRWHDLRATYATILLKNNYNPKAVSKLLGHSKEIITVDIYGDKEKIIEDCLAELEPFINEVRPPKRKINDIIGDESAYIMNEFYDEISKDVGKVEINDLSNDLEYINIIENYISNLKIDNLKIA